MISPLLRWNQGHTVFFHAPNHRLVNVDVPAFANPHSNGLAVFFQKLAAQRNLNVSQLNLQNPRLPEPHLVAALHVLPLRTRKLLVSSARFARREVPRNGTARVLP